MDLPLTGPERLASILPSAQIRSSWAPAAATPPSIQVKCKLWNVMQSRYEIERVLREDLEHAPVAYERERKRESAGRIPRRNGGYSLWQTTTGGKRENFEAGKRRFLCAASLPTCNTGVFGFHRQGSRSRTAEGSRQICWRIRRPDYLPGRSGERRRSL